MKYIILTFTHGSVRAVVDGDTGSVIETNDYYPFGKRIQATGPVAEPVEATSITALRQAQWPFVYFLALKEAITV